jgi:cytochrome c-type protein NapB
LQDRSKRRAFDGAPPVVPHQSFGVACVTCHTETGKEIPTVGIASANPHRGSQQEGAFANCKQCHLFANANDQFVDNSFQGLTGARDSAERAFAGAPPVTPHSVAMRSNCLACHTGIAARPEIRCTHPERTTCQQCHLTVDAEAQFAQFPVAVP